MVNTLDAPLDKKRYRRNNKRAIRFISFMVWGFLFLALGGLVARFFIFKGRLMSKNLVVFENHELGKIRVIEKNGVVYFVAKDVAEALC